MVGDCNEPVVKAMVEVVGRDKGMVMSEIMVRSTSIGEAALAAVKEEGRLTEVGIESGKLRVVREKSDG